eukprot:1121990-Ditylum_brightwellii.AAC.1
MMLMMMLTMVTMIVLKKMMMVLMMVTTVLTSTSHISHKQLIDVCWREASETSMLFVIKTMMLPM